MSKIITSHQRNYTTSKIRTSHFIFRKIRVLCLLGVFLIAGLQSIATIRYVKTVATGTGTGLSWTNASGDLQAMISASTAGDEVWVKSGTYLPTKEPDGTTNSSRDFCFYLKNAVKVYGGFAGTETAITQRIEGSNITTLSGDIGTPNVTTDNAYHVVFSYKDSANTVLNGFTIQGANANASSSPTYIIEGVGILLYRNRGGGMLNMRSNMIVENCQFKNNIGSAYGGGIFNELNDSTKIKHCTFTNNTAGITTGDGGAICNEGVAIIESCIFNNNSASYGGAVANKDSVNYSNCLFSNNTAEVGGAMMNAINNKFAIVTNCTFSSNIGTILCGGIYNVQIAGFVDKMKIKNCIFWNNQTGTPASAIEEGADIWYYTQGIVNISYSSMQLPYNTTNYATARYPSINSSNNVFAVNPIFENSNDPDGADNIFGTSDDGFALHECISPLLNIGTNTGVSSTDITGAARIFNTTVDMGAYENSSTHEINIKGNGNTIANGDLAPNTGNHTNFQNASTTGITQRTFTIFNTGSTSLTIDSISIDNITAGGNFEVSGITLPATIAGSASTTFMVTSLPTTSGTKTAQVHVYNSDCDEANYTFAIQANANNAACLHFDGVNDVVDAGTALGNFGTSDFTIETWFKTSDSVNMSLISKRGSCNHTNFWSMRMVDGKVSSELDQNASQLNYGNLLSTLTYNDGLWHHAAFVRDGIYIYLYVDGILVDNDTTAATTNISNTTSLKIGYSPCGYFNGDLDETRIWNRALTLCEIQHNMNCEIVTTAPSLLANYHYDQGLTGVNNSSVTTLSDASGNNNTGTLQNFALTGFTSNWKDAGAVSANCSAYIDNEINVQGNAANIVDGSTVTSTTNFTDFGSVSSLTSLSRTFTIQNNSVAPLAISSITKSGTNASLFTIGTYPSSIAANSSATFTVTFSPNFVGLKTATITINNNDCDEGVYTFAIQGTGTCTNDTVMNTVSACNNYTWAANNITYLTSGNYTASFINSTGCDSIQKLNLTIYQSQTPKAYIPNSGSNNVSVINLLTNTIIGNINVGNKPIGVAVSKDGNRAYVVNQESSNVSVINTHDNTFIGSFPVGSSPIGIAISPNGNIAYTASIDSNLVTVSNTSSMTTIATIATGTSPFFVAITPDGSKVYVTNNSSNNVNVISTSTNTITATIAVGNSPRGIAVSIDGSKVYVVNSGSNNVSVINTSTNTVIATIPVGNFPIGVVASPDGSRVCVSNNTSNTVSIINTTSNTVVLTIPVGTAPRGVSYSNDGSRLYVVNTNSNNVSVINTSTNTVSNTIAVGNAPYSVGNFISSELVDSVSSCDSYTWGGTTYTASGTYTHTFTNAGGCDSFQKIILTIKNSNTGSSSASSCNTYVWSGTTYTTSGVYTKTFTNVAGCDSVHTLNLTINPLPTITITGNGIICIGASTTLTATGAVNYLWMPGSTSGTVSTVSPSSNTIYTITGTDANGCSKTATKVVTLNALPTVGSTASASTICNGASVTLNGTGAISYSWSGGISNGIAFIPIATTTYTVTGTNANGCTKTATKTISIYPFVNPAASATPSTICLGDTLSLSANTILGLGNDTAFYEGFANNSQGWTLDTEWQIGAATTSSGHNYGISDPAADHTTTLDNGVAGVIIGGNASTALHATYYITSPVINLSSLTTAQLNFWRWLNSDYTPFMQNLIDVWNGSTWINIWASSGFPGILDNTWNLQSYDITPYINAAFKFRIGHSVGSANAFIVSSWNIDDVSITGLVPVAPSITWTGPSMITSPNTNTTSAIPSNSGINTYTVTVNDVYGCTHTSTVNATVNNCGGSILNLKLFIEGYYAGSGMMQSVLMNQGMGSNTTICDSIDVELHDGINLALVDQTKTILNTDGTATCNFTATLNGNYYIVVKHRNSLQTWSENPVLISTISTYDFTTSANQAFGSNQKEIEPGVWAIYSGDINQDGAIDVFDYLLQDPDIVNGNSGYLNTDLNGDGIVDVFDYLVMDPNLVAGVGAMIP